MNGTLIVDATIDARLSSINTIIGNLSSSQGLSADLSVGHAVADYYSGEYEFTPSEEVQTISILNKTAGRNITINPIPNNYGRVEWNGSVLTVS